MTDHQTVVSEYDDLAEHPFLKASEPDAIARELNDLGQRADWEVIVCEEWLIDDKAVESIPTHYRIVTGRVERETDKAILLSQGETDSWLPKSCTRSFVHGGEELDVPQSGLDQFARGGSA